MELSPINYINQSLHRAESNISDISENIGFPSSQSGCMLSDAMAIARAKQQAELIESFLRKNKSSRASSYSRSIIMQEEDYQERLLLPFITPKVLAVMHALHLTWFTIQLVVLLLTMAYTNWYVKIPHYTSATSLLNEADFYQQLLPSQSGVMTRIRVIWSVYFFMYLPSVLMHQHIVLDLSPKLSDEDAALLAEAATTNVAAAEEIQRSQVANIIMSPEERYTRPRQKQILNIVWITFACVCFIWLLFQLIIDLSYFMQYGMWKRAADHWLKTANKVYQTSSQITKLLPNYAATLRHLHRVQGRLACCGWNSYQDWLSVNSSRVPFSCCRWVNYQIDKSITEILENTVVACEHTHASSNTSLLYTRGCSHEIAKRITQDWLQPHFYSLLVICLLQLPQLALALFLVQPDKLTEQIYRYKRECLRHLMRFWNTQITKLSVRY